MPTTAQLPPSQSSQEPTQSKDCPVKSPLDQKIVKSVYHVAARSLLLSSMSTSMLSEQGIVKAGSRCAMDGKGSRPNFRSVKRQRQRRAPVLSSTVTTGQTQHYL
ncbi:hypothetical protein IG631_18121 [Alternaria alternata]|nr:hypothetical protein IG631_18121 [Alternaria alternata]